DTTQGDAQSATGQRDHRRFDQELKRDVPSLGAQGAADADFLGALGDAGQHDVHDADAADNQGDEGDATHDEVEHAIELFGVAQDFQRDFDLVIAGPLMALLQNRLDHVGRLFHILHAFGLHPDFGELDDFAFLRADVALDDVVVENRLAYRQREINVLVDVAGNDGRRAAGAQAGFFQDAHHLEHDDAGVGCADDHFLADRVLI